MKAELAVLFAAALFAAPLSAAPSSGGHKAQSPDVSGMEWIDDAADAPQSWFHAKSYSILPSSVTHGPLVVPIEFTGRLPKRSDVVAELRLCQGASNRRGPLNVPLAMRVPLSLLPGVPVKRTFAVPVNATGYWRRLLCSGDTRLNVSEAAAASGGDGAAVKCRLVSSGKAVFSSDWFPRGSWRNILVSGAVDAISTVADYQRDDEAAKKKKSKAGGDTISYEFDRLPADSPLWSGDWRAYGPYDAVLLSASDWDEIPAAARRALAGYAAHGGLLLLSGANALPAEAKGFLVDSSHSAKGVFGVGFGEVRLVGAVGADRLMPVPREVLEKVTKESKARLASMCGEEMDTSLAAQELDASSFPRMSLGFVVTVLLAFTVVVIPGVVIACAVRKRRMASLVVLPSVAAGIAVFSAVGMLVVYGVTPTLHQKAYVVIDQEGRRAAVHSLAGVFAPMDETAALRFSKSGAVTALRPATVGDLVLEDGPELRASGSNWMRPMSPAAYAVSDVCDTTARIDVRESESGSLRATNLLGVEIESLTVFDAEGAPHVASNIVAGATAELKKDVAHPQRATPMFGFNSPSGVSRPVTERRRVYLAKTRGVPAQPDLLGGGKAYRTVAASVFGRWGKEAE